MTEAKTSLRPRNLIIAATVIGAMVGVPTGVGTYTFTYAEGASYLHDDPAACANCHIMHEQYDGWLKGSHKNVATCNDCHTPAALAPKYFVKALNGWNHSVAFTTGRFHEPIRITELNRRVTEDACRKCHSEITSAIDALHSGAERISCIRCHSDVGHMH